MVIGEELVIGEGPVTGDQKEGIHLKWRTAFFTLCILGDRVLYIIFFGSPDPGAINRLRIGYRSIMRATVE